MALVVMPEWRELHLLQPPWDIGICGPGQKELQEMALRHQLPTLLGRGLWVTTLSSNSCFLKTLGSPPRKDHCEHAGV